MVNFGNVDKLVEDHKATNSGNSDLVWGQTGSIYLYPIVVIKDGDMVFVAPTTGTNMDGSPRQFLSFYGLTIAFGSPDKEQNPNATHEVHNYVQVKRVGEFMTPLLEEDAALISEGVTNELNLTYVELDEEGNYVDHTVGKLIEINRKGTGNSTKYSVSAVNKALVKKIAKDLGVSVEFPSDVNWPNEPITVFANKFTESTHKRMSGEDETTNETGTL